ncbi:MAG: CHC2 zinc finger domain-containing protein [Ferruginibacter sp.]
MKAEQRISSFKEAKEIDLVEYLYTLGFKPVKIRGNDYWYLSPLRDEKTPSFKVDRKINCWYDHGLGKGGNIIDFGKLYFNCTAAEFIKKLNGDFSLHQPVNVSSVKEISTPKIIVLGDFMLSSPHLINYLAKRRIPYDIADKYCREVRYQMNDKVYYGIGFRTDSGSFEIRNPFMKSASSPKSITRPEDDTYTVIIGNFHNEGYGEYICLAQIFWIGKEGKVDKLLIISTVPLSISKHFSTFADIAELRKRLRNTDSVQLFNDNFTQYSEHFRRLFGINSDKAIDLFYQTVSMKSVSSLTDFVKEQMLERTDVKEQIAALLKRFDDLKKSHDAVVNAREQHQILKPLTENSVEYGIVSREIEKIDIMLEVVPSWFATQKKELLSKAVETTTDDLDLAEQVLTRLMNDKKELDNKHLGILQDINNGGKRLEQIDNEIRQHEKDKGKKQDEFNDYEKLVKQCKLETVSNENDFFNNIKKAKEINENCILQETDLKQQRDDVMSELRKYEGEIKEEKKELESLKERQTQIPGWLIAFRLQLCSDLQIAEADLPFVGELLRVNENEQ